MRNDRNRRFFYMERDFFSMSTRFGVDKLTSSVAMAQPINIENFVECFGSSGFTRVYAGNTFRTVAVHPEKKSELSLDDAIKTTTYDFFKNNGNFIGQIILFLSTEQDQKNSLTSTKMSIDSLEKNIYTLITPILIDYIAGRRDDLEQRFLEKFQTQIISKIGSTQSITCVLTTVKPENIKNTIISLPKNCDVFLEDEKISFTALRSGADQCYVVTKNQLFHYKKGNQDTTIRQEIKLTDTSFLKLRENLSKLKHAESLDGFFPQTKDDLSLQTVMHVLPPKYQPVKLVTDNNSGKSAYTTLVINHGKHLVSIIDSAGSSTKLNEVTIQHLQLNEIVQIESQPGLLNVNKQELKEIKYDKDKDKEKKYAFPPYFKAVRENLYAQAEAMRKQAYKYWEAPTAKAWLFLISHLWAFQNRLESGDLQQPEDPTYELLRTASLTYFWPLTKALQNVQSLEEDAKEISEEDLVEIKKQWQEASTPENKSQPLTWPQAFKKQHQGAPIKIGGEVRILVAVPIGHAHSIINFSALPISSESPTQLKCGEHHFIEGQNRIILSVMPPASQTLSTLDAIREFYCHDSIQYLAKLTVLYSPRYIEESGWLQSMQAVRDKVLKSLAIQIFTNLNMFDSGVTKNLRELISTILSEDPFEDVKANLLFCLFVKDKKNNTISHRYLIGVGNCMALTFKDNEYSTVINALYDSEKDVPVLLNSLNRPDDPIKLISGSRIRQAESIQIVDITDDKEILFCSGRLPTGPDLLNENKKEGVTSRFKFRKYKLNIDKLLLQNESKKEKLIDQVVDALQINRRKFLDIIENPNMISAWKKIEDLLRGQQFKSVEEKLKKSGKKESKQEPENSQLIKFNAWNKIEGLMRGLQKNLQGLDQKESSNDVAEENTQLTTFIFSRDTVDNTTTATDFIKELANLSQQYYELQSDQELFSTDESSMVEKLWEIATIEAKELSWIPDNPNLASD